MAAKFGRDRMGALEGPGFTAEPRRASSGADRRLAVARGAEWMGLVARASIRGPVRTVKRAARTGGEEVGLATDVEDPPPRGPEGP